MNGSREKILKRLRAAKPVGTEPVARRRDAALFRDYPDTHEQCLAQFATQFISLKGEWFRSKDPPAAAAQLRSLLQALAPAEGTPPALFLRHADSLLDEIMRNDPWLERHDTVVSGEISNADFEKFQAGITAADYLVARTGSIVLQANAAGGRRLSILPPFHIVLARAAQVVHSLDEVFAAYEAQHTRPVTSYLTVITGPSRTSDIEKTLVLGAHGPKRLAVILIG